MQIRSSVSQPLRLLLRAGCGVGAVLLLGVTLMVTSVSGCGGGGTQLVTAGAATAEWDWHADAGLPSDFPIPAVPADNPMTRAKVALGRFLFYDKQLSGNGTMACASCHLQDKAFTDGRTTGVGSTGEVHPRNAQGLANVAFNATLTWANPLLLTLERQMETPLFGAHPVEMGLNSANQAKVLARFSGDAAGVGYPEMFALAFPDVPAAERVSIGNIIKAIAAFERTMFSGDSKYDRWLKGQATLSEAEMRGMNLFNGETAECFHCHTDFNFNDQVRHARRLSPTTPFHNTGLYNIDGRGGFPEPNRGVYEISLVASDMGKFRAPSLRNVAVTAPYMHDGSKATLEAVLDHYANGGTVTTSGANTGDGRANPYKSDLISNISLTDQDKADLIAFLKTLTDETLLSNPKLADPFAARP